MRDYKIYLKDILAAVDSIEAFVNGFPCPMKAKPDKVLRPASLPLLSSGSLAAEHGVRPKNRYCEWPGKDVLSLSARRPYAGR
ncbi:MAG: hypothetical protein HY913_04745 [Desulfomonile tiedjei]|nr:hypothetical protein [Desulfomonile tiedjei]